MSAGRQPSEMETDAVSTILWIIIALLLVFWLIGAFFTTLGDIVWIALVVAAILIVYNLLAGSRSTTQ